MTNDLLWAGLQLMLVGMGTVFAFLTLLVVATSGMSRLVSRLQPEEPEGAQAPLPEPGSQQEHVAAIAAAIAMHRRRG